MTSNPWAILDGLQDPVFVTDREHRFVYVNRAVCALARLDIKDMLGKRELGIVSKEVRELYWQTEDQIFKTGEPKSIERDVVLPNGAKHVLLTTKSLISGADGEKYILSVVTDLTKYREADERVQKSEQILNSVLKHAPAMVYAKDVDGKYLIVNGHFEETFGLSLDELKTKNDRDLFAPHFAQQFRDNDETVMKKGEPVTFEERVPHPDGMHDYISVKVPLRDADGKIYGICGVSTDITERIQAAEKLTKSEALYQSLLSNVPGAVFRLQMNSDGTTELLFMSEGARELFERTPQELMEAHPTRGIVVHPDDEASLYAEMRRSAETLTPSRWEGRLSLPSGKLIWIQSNSRPRKMEDGSVIWDGYTMNVTSRKELENLVEAQRVKSISSAKMASLGEMAANIAHEINNPLAIIAASAAKLGRQAESGKMELEDLRKNVERITRTTDRIARIIRGLQTFARDGAKDPLTLSPIKQIVQDSVDLCQERLKTHHVDLKITPICEKVQIECRTVQLCQVLVNLLSNAFDAVSSLDSRWIEVDCLDEGETITLSVTDSGNGITPELADKIFHPFFTTKDTGKGTGLGLSIASGIVADHHGTIAVDMSHPHTRFILKLPKRQPQP